MPTRCCGRCMAWLSPRWETSPPPFRMREKISRCHRCDLAVPSMCPALPVLLLGTSLHLCPQQGPGFGVAACLPLCHALVQSPAQQGSVGRSVMLTPCGTTKRCSCLSPPPFVAVLGGSLWLQVLVALGLCGLPVCLHRHLPPLKHHGPEGAQLPEPVELCRTGGAASRAFARRLAPGTAPRVWPRLSGWFRVVMVVAAWSPSPPGDRQHCFSSPGWNRWRLTLACVCFYCVRLCLLQPTPPEHSLFTPFIPCHQSYGHII